MTRTQRLVVVLVLNLALVAALVIVGMTAHSLAVLAEGSDYLLDAAGVAVALLAIRLSARPASRARPSPTDIAALVNCGWLLVLEVLVVSAAAERLITGTPHVNGLPVLIVSGVAALTMTVAALVLRADDDDADGRNLSVAGEPLLCTGDDFARTDLLLASIDSNETSADLERSDEPMR